MSVPGVWIWPSRPERLHHRHEESPRAFGMKGTVTDVRIDPGDDEPTEGGQSGGCGDGDGCGRQ